MGSLSSLTSEEIAAIADFLAPALEGAALYADTCAVCHGTDASGGIGPNIQGKTASDIQDALATVSAMAFLRGTLTQDQIQAIADFLATLVGGPPPPAVQIDASLCMQCHGADLDGGIARISCFACHNGPEGNVGHPPTWLLKEDPIHFHGRYAKDFGIACTACHSADLTGGIGPSCFTCHDSEELEDVLARISEAED
jgi:mono/diheme cytochrome c family protein